MWKSKIIAVSWLCMLWTKVDFASTEDVSTSGFPAGTVAPTGPEIPPERFDWDVTKSYSADSTVRSFFPVRGKQKWMRRSYPPAEEMLFFNVSIVSDDEEVSAAELHLHRRRIAKIHGSYHKRFLPLPYRVVLYQVQPNYRHKFGRDTRTTKLASLPVSHVTKSGWHTLDVTAVLRELLINAQGPAELLLGVHFEAPRSGPKTYSSLVPLKHFLKPTDHPDPDHPYRSSSYLVLFSEIDPYFDEFEDADGSRDESDESENDIPDGHVFRERHLKHKISKVRSNEVINSGSDGKRSEARGESKEKNKAKYKPMENEVYKTNYGRGKEDAVRHKSKHRASDIKRSKADELALQQKNKLKSLPFLHTNEVEEIRQTSRRLTRSVPASSPDNRIPGKVPQANEMRRLLEGLVKEIAESLRGNETGAWSCTKKSVSVNLSSIGFGLKVISPLSFVTAHCSGSCSAIQDGSELRTCSPRGRKSMDVVYRDPSGKIISTQLKDFLATDCECR